MNLSTTMKTAVLVVLVRVGFAEAKPLAGSRPNIILVMMAKRRLMFRRTIP